MREVTAAEFWAWLYADPRDIMPSVEDPKVTNWYDGRVSRRSPVAITYPGWRDPGGPKRYYISGT